MYTIEADSVDRALSEGLQFIISNHVEIPSRYGKVWAAPYPIVTAYHRPEFRVLRNPVRDANPFFHFFESLWMLAGRNDLAFMKRFVSDFGQFSDDGKTLHGAYGYRWRNHFNDSGNCDMDQIAIAIEELRTDRTTRRVVLQMWDPAVDLGGAGKDLPCNTSVYFRPRSDMLGRIKLDMTVCNRSNDIIWGAYGANAVHMSMLHEFVAASVGLPMGVYYQFSNDWHVYIDKFPIEKLAAMIQAGGDPYMPLRLRRDTVNGGGGSNGALLSAEWAPYPIMVPGTDHHDWELELERFLDMSGEGDYAEPFFQHVAKPMLFSHTYFKNKYMDDAVRAAMSIAAADWRMACTEWLHRRAK